MGRNRIVYAAALGFAFLFYCCYYKWFSWYLLVLVLCLPVLSLVCSLPGMLALRLRATAPRMAPRGKDAALCLELRSPLPWTGCQVRVEVRAFRGALPRQEKLLLQGKETRLPLPTVHCGVVEYTVTKARVYDFLGLFSLPVRGGGRGEVMVCPVPAPLAVLSFSPARPLGYKKSTTGMDAWELRPYVPGDDLRHVHWKLSAKQDDLLVRERLEEKKALPVLLFDPGTNAETTDWVLERLVWASRELLARGIPHEVRWQEGTAGEHRRVEVARERDLQLLVERLVRALPRVQADNSPIRMGNCLRIVRQEEKG